MGFKDILFLKKKEKFLTCLELFSSLSTTLFLVIFSTIYVTLLTTTASFFLNGKNFIRAFNL